MDKNKPNRELENYPIENIEDLLKINARLRESEELFRLLVEGVEDYAIFGLDTTGHVLTWNAGAQRLKGYHANEIIGRHFSCFYTAQDVQAGRPAELLRRAEVDGRVKDEGWRVRKDGSLFFADIVITALKDKAGVLKGFTKINRDMTQRRELDESLMKTQDQLMESQRIAHLGSWEWDFVHKSISWSDELYRIHGLTPQSVPIRFRDVLRYIHPNDRRSVLKISREAIMTSQPFSFDYRIITSAGKERQLRAFGQVVLNSAHQPTRLMGTSQDITDQKKSERALQQKEAELFQSNKLEAIGRLAGGVAHDFNNLITGILGISQDLQQTFSLDDPRREEMDELIKASHRAFEVTRQLLALGRRQVISPKVININETIKDFTKLLQRLIGEDIKLELRLSDRSHVRMDSGYMGQVLLNLSLNARDAMPKGGVILIQTANIDHTQENGKRTPCVLLEITDTGSGMDQETLAHIFEPFFTTKPKDHGTGLGLATVYGIIKQSGGDISVDSQLGNGTTFRIYMPRELHLDVGIQEPAQTTSPLGGHETILVVEDEDIVRRVVVRRLESVGYTVLETNHPLKALDLFKEKGASIDLVITDVIMPELNGKEVIDRIRTSHPNIAVLYMSAYPNEIIAHRSILDPGINFLEKSAIQRDLFHAVRKALARTSKNPPAVETLL